MNPEPLYMNWLKEGGHYPWQRLDVQKLIWEKETAEILINNFEDVFSKIDKEAWKKRTDIESVGESSLVWPYN